MNNKKTATVIGGGFGGLSVACYLAHAGYKVTLLEKNPWLGGRAQVWESEGFRFDMGPSFYWMPEVFDTFFEDIGKKRTDYYSIQQLDPSYNCVFGDGSIVDIPADFNALTNVFEAIEPGAGKKLQSFVQDSKNKYEISMKSFIYRQFDTILDFLDPEVFTKAASMDLLTGYSKLVRKNFKSPELRAIMEYPTVFLGAPGNKIPGTYTLMNYVDFVLGTWYPEGGFSGVIEALCKSAVELGVTIRTNEEVTQVSVQNKTITGVTSINQNYYQGDVIVSALPYHHFESLLPRPLRQYSDSYWNNKTLAPSCLNFYIGLDRELSQLRHHTFFFDEDWDTHFDATYGTKPRWNEDPLFYAHVASKTDSNVAPAGCDSLFILIPVAPGLEDTQQTRDVLRAKVIQRINTIEGFDIQDHIITERSYAHKDFISDYHALKGSGFGLGHTLFQTASFRPRNKSRKVSNLYFAGQDTIPGTSTVMSLISGKVTSQTIIAHEG